MKIINETAERTTTTAAATMAGLAAPSQGSIELSTWRVRMPADSRGPVHTVDREQVFMPVTGSFTVTLAGDTGTVAPGQAVILPAGVVRQIAVADGPAEALVCMPVGGQATVPGSDARRPLPWAA